MEAYELKPNKAAFLTYPLVKWLLVSSLALLALSPFLAVTAGISAVAAAVLVFIVSAAWSYYSMSVRYRKEKYEFFRDRIVKHSGGVFSDSETELAIRNITQVKMQLPFIENRMFGTGNIEIQSAGSGGIEISLQSINKPDKLYEYAERLMKTNGFSLSKEKLVQEEKPSTLAVLAEVIGGIAVGVLFLPALALVAVFGTPYFILRYLDLKRRVYRIYSDTITYTEGFLTKNYSFIPIQNLADSEVNQNLFDKVFGLYDVKLSSQGAGNEVHFGNMKNGPRMEENIDRLIGTLEPLVGAARQAKKKTAAKAPKAMLDTSYMAEFRMHKGRTLFPLLIGAAIGIAVILLITPVAIIASDGRGGQIALIAASAFLLVVLGAAIGTVPIIIRTMATKYNIKKSSIEERYDFLHSRHKEFSNDKIMAVVFRENFIDKWFRTCSVQFLSIGSSQSINFANIAKKNGLYESILSKAGIRKATPIYRVSPQFSAASMIAANIRSALSLAVAAIALAAAALIFHWAFTLPIIAAFPTAVALVIYKDAYYKKSFLELYNNFVHFRKGLLFKEYHYALYENVKDITTVKYPGSLKGDATFNIAGEQIVEAQSGYGRGGSLAGLLIKSRGIATIISNHFTISYVTKVATKDDIMDALLQKTPPSAEKAAAIEQNISKYAQKPLLAAKPAVANTLLPLLIIGIPVIVVSTAAAFFASELFRESFGAGIFAALAILAAAGTIAGIITAVIKVKVTRYSIEPSRLVKRWGMLYKSQQSLIRSKIDHINMAQGMLNKMFGNGSVTINTTGSSSAEMIVENVPNYREFYKELQKGY